MSSQHGRGNPAPTEPNSCDWSHIANRRGWVPQPVEYGVRTGGCLTSMSVHARDQDFLYLRRNACLDNSASADRI